MRQIITDTVNKFFPSKRKEKGQEVVENQTITLTPVVRRKNYLENHRRSYATELLDTYYGFGLDYLKALIKVEVKSKNIQQQMIPIRIHGHPLVTRSCRTLRLSGEHNHSTLDQLYY